MPPPWMCSTAGSGPSASAGRWMYRPMSLPSGPLIVTSLRSDALDRRQFLVQHVEHHLETPARLRCQ